jgi:hypothetical protein
MKIKTATTIIYTNTTEIYRNFTEVIIDDIITESIDDPAGTVAINALNCCTRIFQGTATISEVYQFFHDGYTLMALPNADKFLDSYTGSLDDVELHIAFPESRSRDPYIVPGRYLNGRTITIA